MQDDGFFVGYEKATSNGNVYRIPAGSRYLVLEVTPEGALIDFEPRSDRLLGRPVRFDLRRFGVELDILSEKYEQMRREHSGARFCDLPEAGREIIRRLFDLCEEILMESPDAYADD